MRVEQAVGIGIIDMVIRLRWRVHTNSVCTTVSCVFLVCIHCPGTGIHTEEEMEDFHLAVNDNLLDMWCCRSMLLTPMGKGQSIWFRFLVAGGQDYIVGSLVVE